MWAACSASDCPPLSPPSPLSPRLFKWASVALGAVVLLGTLAWAWGFTSIYRNLNTRLAATRWLYDHVPGPFTLTLDTTGSPSTEIIAVPDGLTLSGDQPYRTQFTAHQGGTVAGGGKGRPVHVAVEVDVGVLDPVGRAEPARRLDQAPPEGGQQREPLLDQPLAGPEAAAHDGLSDRLRDQVAQGRVAVAQAGGIGRGLGNSLGRQGGLGMTRHDDLDSLQNCIQDTTFAQGK